MMKLEDTNNLIILKENAKNCSFGDLIDLIRYSNRGYIIQSYKVIRKKYILNI